MQRSEGAKSFRQVVFRMLVIVQALILFPSTSRAQTNLERTLLLVVGAPGAAEYAAQFTNWANSWMQAAAKGGLSMKVIGLDESAEGPDDRARLLSAIKTEEA